MRDNTSRIAEYKDAVEVFSDDGHLPLDEANDCRSLLAAAKVLSRTEADADLVAKLLDRVEGVLAPIADSRPMLGR